MFLSRLSMADQSILIKDKNYNFRFESVTKENKIRLYNLNKSKAPLPAELSLKIMTADGPIEEILLKAVNDEQYTSELKYPLHTVTGLALQFRIGELKGFKVLQWGKTPPSKDPH